MLLKGNAGGNPIQRVTANIFSLELRETDLIFTLIIFVVTNAAVIILAVIICAVTILAVIVCAVTIFIAAILVITIPATNTPTQIKVAYKGIKKCCIF